MGCGFSKFGATTDGEVGSSLRIKTTKPPLEKIVERSSKWRIIEQRGGHRRDNSLSQKFLEESSSSSEDQQADLGDDIIIMPQTQSNHGPTSTSAGVERKFQNESGNNNEKPRDQEGKGEDKAGIREEVRVVNRHRHPRRDRDDVVGVKSDDNAANGSCVRRNGGDETDEDEEEEDYYSDRQDSIIFQFQGSPSFKEYCTANGHDDNGNYEEEEEGRRRGKKLEMNCKIVSAKSIKIQSSNNK